MNNDTAYPIVTAGWHDLGELRKLEKECFKNDAWPLIDLLAVLSLPNIVRLKALDKNKMVGFIAGDVNSREKIGWITTIAVKPSHQRRGIAIRLMTTCVEMMDLPTIRLSLRPSNLAALNLYTRLGYRQVDTWHRYYYDEEDALVLEKKR